MKVIVVGLGAMGSAVTYQLATRGVDVVGIDRFSPPHAYGSSHGDTRITRRLTLEGVEYAPLAARSQVLWRDIEAATGEDIFTANGVLHIADLSADPAAFDNHQGAAAALGIEHERLGPAELRARFGQFNVGSDDAAFFEPGGGFVRPEAAIRAQLTLAERSGATLRRDELVEAIEPGPGGVTVSTDQGTYAGDQVVVAAGGWLATLLGEPRLASLFRVYRQVLQWYLLDGSAAEFGPASFPTFIWRCGVNPQERFYGFPTLDGRTIKIATGQFAVTSDPDSLDRTVGPREHTDLHRRLIAPRLPAVSAEAPRGTVCMYTVTPDRGFVLDRHPGHERVFIASPCSGHGFKHSAAIGEAVAELLTTGNSTIDLKPFGLDRFGLGG